MLPRIAKYSIKNILRNKFLSISSVLVLTLLMFFINILVILDDISYKLIESINSRLTISLYLDNKYSNNSLDVIDFMEDIRNLRNTIEVNYKTKDDILNELRLKEPNLVKILERTNPLPDTIVLSNINLSDYSRVNSLIENKLYLLATNESEDNYFANYSTQYKKIQDITNVLDILKL
jgi:cell division transport system permease protein